MSQRETERVPLTGEQRRRVQDNLGLIAVHLRRNVGNLAEPRRDREWEDLFQEGCLGLIQASTTYRPESGIPFAAYALARIHNAVSRALQSKFATVYVPPKRKPVGCGDDRSRMDQANSDPTHQLRRPRVHLLSDEHQRRLADRSHHPDSEGGETVGDRLRDKYERAARTAGENLSRKASSRGDRDKLIRILMAERLLVPSEEARTALRAIARRTKSSYARVAQCDKQLGKSIRKMLEGDPEFCELQDRSRLSPDGNREAIDGQFERELAAVGADEFVRRLRHADGTGRVQMIEAVLGVLDSDIERLIHRHVAGLDSSQRESLLGGTRLPVA